MQKPNKQISYVNYVLYCTIQSRTNWIFLKGNPVVELDTLKLMAVSDGHVEWCHGQLMVNSAY